MSTFDQVYLGMVIVGMAALVIVLAWATLYTAGAKSTPAAKATEPVAANEDKLAA